MAEIYSKQQLIDTYGHFFVLCNEHPSGYIGRVLPADSYARIGNLDYQWKPDETPKFVILEFLGEPHMQSRDKARGYGILEGLNYDDRGQSVFTDVEVAEAQAKILKGKVSALYEKLRDIGKTRDLPFNTDTPEMAETEQRLLPDQMKFLNPSVFCKGGKLFCVNRTVTEVPLAIEEVELISAELSPYVAKQNYDEESKTYSPLQISYALKIFTFVPTPRTSIGVERIFRYDPADPDMYRYYLRGNDAPEFSGGLRFATTVEKAEQDAQETALQAYRNISACLPRPTIPTAG